VLGYAEKHWKEKGGAKRKKKIPDGGKEGRKKKARVYVQSEELDSRREGVAREKMGGGSNFNLQVKRWTMVCSL